MRINPTTLRMSDGTTRHFKTPAELEQFERVAMMKKHEKDHTISKSKIRRYASGLGG